MDSLRMEQATRVLNVAYVDEQLGRILGNGEGQIVH